MSTQTPAKPKRGRLTKKDQQKRRNRQENLLGSDGLLNALRHPLRVMIFYALIEGPKSPVEIAREKGESVQLISYHVRILRDAGVLVLTSTTPRRGAIEHHYAIVPGIAGSLVEMAGELQRLAGKVATG